MQTYNYTKAVDPEVLQEAIQLRTTLRNFFVSCSVVLLSDGSAFPDNVEIIFSKVLESSEEDQVISIINEMGPTYDLIIRKSIERNTMKWAMEKGKEILAQFASSNLYMQKTDAQIEALVTEYPDLIHSLVTGSLKTAYITFLSMTPDDNISQPEIDEFSTRLAIILGIPA